MKYSVPELYLSLLSNHCYHYYKDMIKNNVFRYITVDSVDVKDQNIDLNVA